MTSCCLNPAHTSTSTEDEISSLLCSPFEGKPCFQELTAARISKTALQVHLELNYEDVELVGYTRPPLTEVVQWINFEAQNMAEPPY